MNKTEPQGAKIEKLSECFNKKHGEFLYSGTLALETALIAAGVKKNDYVILPDNVCFKVLLSVVRCKAIPILINPANRVNLTTGDVMESIRKYPVKAIILVHNFGIPVNVKSFRDRYADKYAIIEDCAQAWDLKCQGESVGKYSDFVITSFGSTKPTRYGFGGAIFGDSEDFKILLDYGDRRSRNSQKVLLPYVLPSSTKISSNVLMLIGNKVVKKQREIADAILSNLNNDKVTLWQSLDGDSPSWHRFPIWIHDKKDYARLMMIADRFNVIYELPFSTPLHKLPIAVSYNCVYVDNSKTTSYQINIKPFINSTKNIRKWCAALTSSKK